VEIDEREVDIREYRLLVSGRDRERLRAELNEISTRYDGSASVKLPEVWELVMALTQ